LGRGKGRSAQFITLIEQNIINFYFKNNLKFTLYLVDNLLASVGKEVELNRQSHQRS